MTVENSIPKSIDLKTEFNGARLMETMKSLGFDFHSQDTRSDDKIIYEGLNTKDNTKIQIIVEKTK